MKIKLLVAFFILNIISAWGQTFPYSVSVLNEPYADLTGTTALTNAPWDDPEISVPIGFDFVFFGDTTNTLYGVGLGGLFSPIENFYYEPTHLLLAYASDLMDRGYNTGEHLSPISYKTEGTPGNRILKIEWKNAGFWGEITNTGTNTNFINLQLWLYETSNDVEMRFGPNNITLDADVHDLNGTSLIGFIEGYNANASDWDYFWYLTGPSATPKVGVSEDYYDYYSIQGFSEDPADGTVYRFSTGVTPSFERPEIEGLFKIYPTLVTDEIIVESESADAIGAVISVRNNLGQLTLRQQLDSDQQIIHLGEMQAGIYFVTIETEEGYFTKKIIKK